ncbi:MAG: trypsin-like peptidase domain-containing protein [Planctomycetota bacterium]|jgi:serine protease Do|nr:trypsin-like peptidase domain-containing protein [Planctomycetota bacterium]
MSPASLWAGLSLALFLPFAGLFNGGTLAAVPYQVEKLADFRQVIANAKAAVFPSLVFLMPVAERYDAGKLEKMQVAGSGVIISPGGEVVTNWHVVERSIDIRCLLYDGTVVKASVVGTDKDTDLALLQLELPPGKTVPAARLGDSSHLEAGEFVLAMGAPWGLSRSVSLGILSCVDRFLSDQGGGYNLWLQTDAAINPGNSGGPLVDSGGLVVGINTLGFLMGGNLAFAIPANTVSAVVGELRRQGRVVRAWAGIYLQPLKDFERNIFYEGEKGVLVAGVDPASPAGLAGIEVGEMLLAINSQPVRGVNHEDIPRLNQELADLPIGRESVFLFRDLEGRQRERRLVPVEKGEVEGADLDCRRWNLTLKAINEFSTPVLAFYRRQGVYVQAVRSPGNAESAGLRSGDIVLELDRIPVPDLETVRRIYQELVEDPVRKREVLFTILRNDLKHYLVIDYTTIYGND